MHNSRWWYLMAKANGSGVIEGWSERQCKTCSSTHCPGGERKTISISRNMSSIPGHSERSKVPVVIWWKWNSMKRWWILVVSRKAMKMPVHIYLWYTWTLEVSVGLTSSVGGFPSPPTAPVFPALTGGALVGVMGEACIKKVRHEDWHIKIFNPTQPCMELFCWHNRHVLNMQQKIGSVITKTVPSDIRAKRNCKKITANPMWAQEAIVNRTWRPVCSDNVWCPMWRTNKPTGNRDPAGVLWKVPEKICKHDINALVHALEQLREEWKGRPLR